MEQLFFEYNYQEAYLPILPEFRDRGKGDKGRLKNDLSKDELDLLMNIPEEKRETAIEALVLYKSLMLNDGSISPLLMGIMLQQSPINRPDPTILETFKMEHQMLMMKFEQEFELKLKIMDQVEKLLESLIEAFQPLLKASILEKGRN